MGGEARRAPCSHSHVSVDACTVALSCLGTGSSIRPICSCLPFPMPCASLTFLAAQLVAISFRTHRFFTCTLSLSYIPRSIYLLSIYPSNYLSIHLSIYLSLLQLSILHTYILIYLSIISTKNRFYHTNLFYCTVLHLPCYPPCLVFGVSVVLDKRAAIVCVPSVPPPDGWTN